MKDKKIARKIQTMYFRAKDVMVLLTYKKDATGAKDGRPKKGR